MRTRLITRVLLLALAVGILVDILIPGNAIGINAPLLVAALLGAALLAAGPAGLRRMDRADAWLGPVALLLAAFAAIRADDWLVAWDLLFAGMLAAGAIAALGGGRITRGVVPHVLELAVGAMGAIVVGVLALAGQGRSTAADAGPVGWAVPGAPPAPPPSPGAPATPTTPPTRPASSGDPAVPGDSPTAPAPGRRARLLVRSRAGIGRSAPVLRGLVIALPVVLVFGVLFAAADAVFAKLAGDVLAWRPDIDVIDIVGRGIVIGIAAWMTGGLLALGAGLLPSFMPALPASYERTAGPGPDPAGRSLGAASVAELPLPSGLHIGSGEASTVLLVVDLLFATFVALQVAYLFGGRDTLAAAGMTYADYAHRGFTELVLVAILAGALVVALDLLVLRRSAVQVGASLVLLALTAVVLASAFLRIRLYQDAYGWTELRFMVVVGIGWLAVALAVVAGLLLARRTQWTLHVLGILVVVTLIGMNVVGPQASVAERNLQRAVDPALVPPGGRTGLDAGYLWELGDEAVPALVSAWPELSPADQATLAPFLADRDSALAGDDDLAGWPAWNLGRERARAALATWSVSR